MRRNMNTVRDILHAALQDGGKPYLLQVRHYIADSVGVGEAEQDFHLELLRHAGYIRYIEQPIPNHNNPLVMLTW